MHGSSQGTMTEQFNKFMRKNVSRVGKRGGSTTRSQKDTDGNKHGIFSDISESQLSKSYSMH